MRTLQNLPFKIELNEWGNIVMSPASNKHSFIQGLIIELLNQLKKGGTSFLSVRLRPLKALKSLMSPGSLHLSSLKIS